MPLSAPAKRDQIHTRAISCSGFRRADGLWDIDGHMTDIKSYAFTNAWRGEIEPGAPLHDMWLRLTLDEDFVIHAVEAVTDAGPFQICPDIAPSFQMLVGLTIDKGFRAAVRQRLGGVHGCTHLVDLLGPMATTAFQAMFPLRQAKAADESQKSNQRPRPAILDTCHALAADSDVVKQHWPEHYTGA